jgi:uncharacterized protein YbaP (TraB family)
LKKLVWLSLLISSIIFAQEKKYQSLLWEISGNGLQKNSYLYGSMHVSEKISYHLSDAFFNHLLEADFVANESEPSEWSELIEMFNFDYNYQKTKLYSRFYLKPFEKQKTSQLVASRNFTMNDLLFRTNEFRKDFQEETYLDMFIYQTGRKYGKKTVGLEDAKESMALIMNIDYSNATPDDENNQKLVRMLRNKSIEEALMDYYREKDLDMMDSLLTLSSPEPYLEAILYKRNRIMTRSFDSIAKHGSIFATVGAAHLPGQKGMIELLRMKGYVVKPVFDSYTEVGKQAKKQIEEFFIRPKFKSHTTQDNFVELPLNDMVLFDKNDLNSPDLANGGYINIKRRPIHNFLRKEKDYYTHLTLDSLFYENIPGNILEKKFYTEKNYVYYDIKNRTKTANAQRYRFYITPLEIIAVNIVGNGNYVRMYESEVFDKIKLKPYTDNWETLTPNKGGFSVFVPSYHIIYGNRSDAKIPELTEIYAYEKNKNAYYFLLERSIDIEIDLQDTEYELKRIQREFYTQYDAKDIEEKPEQALNEYVSGAIIYDQPVFLKTTVSGSKYYLLGTVNADKEDASKFFDSFRLIPDIAPKDFAVYHDSILSFSLEIPKNQNEFYFLSNQKKRPINRKSEKTNIFTSESQNYSFTSPSGHSVDFHAYKYHPYIGEKSIDSILTGFKKWFQNGKNINEAINETDEQDELNVAEDLEEIYEELELATGFSEYGKKQTSESLWAKELGFDSNEKKRYIVLDEKTTKDPKNNYCSYEALISKQNSNQAIKYKVVFQDGYSYRLRTLVPKNYSDDNVFIEKVYNSFKAEEGDYEGSVFDDKLSLFIENAQDENDTIRFSAFKSAHYLTVQKEDLSTLQQFINSFDFSSDEIEALEKLYEKTGQIKDASIVDFLEINYKKENNSPQIQLAILRALAAQKTKEAYKRIAKLLAYDLPLSDSRYEIHNLFEVFKRDSENSTALFPDIFQFYSIKEYHDPIISLSSHLVGNNLMQGKKLKEYKKTILVNAKLEQKRVAGWKSKQKQTNIYEDYGYDNTDEAIADLKSYIKLIYPFRKEKEFSSLLSKIKALDIDKLHLELAEQELSKTGNIDKEIEQKLLKNQEVCFPFIQVVLDNKPDYVLPKYVDNHDVSTSSLFYLYNLQSNAKLELKEMKTIEHNRKKITYFFYKLLPSKNNNLYYSDYQEKIVSIAFVQTKSGNLNYKAFYSSKPKNIFDDDELPEKYNEIIDESLNSHYRRASFGKESEQDLYDYMNFYGGY